MTNNKKELDAILKRIDEVLADKPSKKKKSTTPEKFGWYKKEVDYINKHSSKNPERKKKFTKQLETQGWTDADTWSLDHCLGKWMLPRLKRFKEVNNGYPHGQTEKSWNAILDKMIYAFEIVASDKYYSMTDKKEWAKVNEGLDLFREHFMNLWW